MQIPRDACLEKARLVEADLAGANLDGADLFLVALIAKNLDEFDEDDLRERVAGF